MTQNLDSSQEENLFAFRKSNSNGSRKNLFLISSPTSKGVSEEKYIKSECDFKKDKDKKIQAWAEDCKKRNLITRFFTKKRPNITEKKRATVPLHYYQNNLFTNVQNVSSNELNEKIFKMPKNLFLEKPYSLYCCNVLYKSISDLRYHVKWIHNLSLDAEGDWDNKF